MALWLIPVDGGASRELLKVSRPGTFAGSVGWTTDAKYVLSDMIQKIINDNMSIEDAQAWAQQQMMDSYNKVTKA